MVGCVCLLTRVLACMQRGYRVALHQHLVVEVVEEAQQVVLVLGVCLADVLQQLDLVQALVEVVLVVADDLEAHQLLSLQVQRLHRPAEGG